MSAHEEARRHLALKLLYDEVIITPKSNHKLVVTRGNERGFVDASYTKGPLLPIYIDLHTGNDSKPGPLLGSTVDRATRYMQFMRHEHKLEVSAVAGIPEAGEPFARRWNQLSNDLRLIRLGNEMRAGEREMVVLDPSTELVDTQALLVDDLLAKNTISKFQALRALHEHRIHAAAVMVFLDLEQGGAQDLRRCGCDVYSIFTLRELLDLYVDSEDITEAYRHKVLAHYQKRA